MNHDYPLEMDALDDTLDDVTRPSGHAFRVPS
jgi:hypothetical protein